MIEVIIGFIGMFLILLAFFMNQIHKWKTKNPIYDIVNFCGALLLIIYSYLIKSWPFLILNLIWLVVSFREALVDIEGREKGTIGYKRK
ncbi:MAG: hypothetical protein IB618_02095 [Candidatus Pacearchaeota archaeon]|nr:MAG: hypothetical protein IB618_02095 [Candidatus Pacearchaeota archaeon]